MIEEHEQFWRSCIVAYSQANAATDKRDTLLAAFWILPEDTAFPPGRPVRIRGPQELDDINQHLHLQNLAKAILASQLYVMITSHNTPPQQERAMLQIWSAHWAYTTSRLSTHMAAECDAYWKHLEDLALLRGHEALLIELTQAWARFGLKTPPLASVRSPSKKRMTMARELEAQWQNNSGSVIDRL